MKIERIEKTNGEMYTSQCFNIKKGRKKRNDSFNSQF